MTVIFKGAAKRLADIDLPRIGHKIGVGEDDHRSRTSAPPGSA